MISWIREVFLSVGVSIKMMFRGYYTVILMVFSLILLAAMLLSMDSVKEEKSKIVIGMADEEKSVLSASIIAGMKQKDLYEVVEGEEPELKERLAAGELSAVCVLNKSFSKNIYRGKTNRLVKIYETGNKEALLLSDILAGVMMEEICTSKSYQTLTSFEKKRGKEQTMSLEEYREYVRNLFAEEGMEFSFDAEYIATDGKVKEKPSQSVIYEQAVFAIFALMAGIVSIYSVLPFRSFLHGTAARRVKVLPVRISALYTGSAVAGLLLPMLLGALFLGCLIWQNNADFSNFYSLLVCTGGYVCVIVCIMLVAAMGIRNQTVYQMGMLATILVFGVFGLISLAEGILVPEGTVLWVPNSWYVRKMTELF